MLKGSSITTLRSLWTILVSDIVSYVKHGEYTTVSLPLFSFIYKGKIQCNIVPGKSVDLTNNPYCVILCSKITDVDSRWDIPVQQTNIVLLVTHVSVHRSVSIAAILDSDRTILSDITIKFHQYPEIISEKILELGINSNQMEVLPTLTPIPEFYDYILDSPIGLDRERTANSKLIRSLYRNTYHLRLEEYEKKVARIQESNLAIIKEHNRKSQEDCTRKYSEHVNQKLEIARNNHDILLERRLFLEQDVDTFIEALASQLAFAAEYISKHQFVLFTKDRIHEQTKSNA